MAKSDKDHARQLLEMAGQDLKALQGMRDGSQFSDEVFGFHAQQAVEKSLKAWMAVRHLTYPRSHDLGILIRILEEAGEDFTTFPNLEDYTSFAVQYRYEAYDETEKLNREDAINKASALLAQVKKILDNAT
jgi:HEPN domain-containing protein